MTEDQTTLTRRAAPRPEGVPPVLDEAHIGDIRGALGHDQDARHAASATAGARARWRCWRSWAPA